MLLKFIIKSTLHPYIYLLLKKYYLYFFKGNKASLINIDIKLKKYLNYNEGFFVELGANDGISQSNTYFLEKNKKWKGVLVEPNPYLYQLCTHFRANKGKNRLYCNAVVSKDHKDEFVKIFTNNESGLTGSIKKSISNKISSDSINSSMNSLLFASQAKTLNQLLLISHAPKIIDFMSLDVEGFELDVLKGINYRNFKFKFLLIETKKFKLLKAFLINKNYIFVKKITHHDYLFKYDFN